MQLLSARRLAAWVCVGFLIASLLYDLEKKEAHWELLKSTDYAGIFTLGLGCLQVFLEKRGIARTGWSRA